MGAAVEITITDDRWQDVDLPAMAAECFAAVFKDQAVDPRYEVSILACDDPEIAALNGDFRGKPQPTNVLSWPAFELAPSLSGGAPQPPPTLPPPTPQPPFFDTELGDIALSFDTCAREAAEGNIPFDNHLRHLLTHSCLHLLGYDHETDADAARMQKIETLLLANMGIADPY